MLILFVVRGRLLREVNISISRATDGNEEYLLSVGVPREDGPQSFLRATITTGTLKAGDDELVNETVNLVPQTRALNTTTQRQLSLGVSDTSITHTTDEDAVSRVAAAVERVMTVIAHATQSRKDVTIALIRAIGNPLPPRHSSEQALTNLKFTLEHELAFPRVTKHWVLNRLIDTELEQQLIHLLESKNTTYTVIPFDLKEYEKISYTYHYMKTVKGSGKDIIHTRAYETNYSENKYLRVDESIQHGKNVYVTNQNIARNKMLEIGLQSEADWIFPWDGNCFLTKESFLSIYNGLSTINSFQRYAAAPMARATSNEQLLEKDFTANPVEEPQVMFRRDAQARFNPKLPYGRRNKVEMLQRLQVPGPWDYWQDFLKWEHNASGPLLQPVPDFTEPAPNVGWVTRLFSGNTQSEAEGAFKNRALSRSHSMNFVLSKLDARAARVLHNYTSSKLMFYDEQALKINRAQANIGNEKIRPTMQNLLQLADTALKEGPWIVNAEPEAYAPSRLAAMQSNTTILALGYYFSGKQDFARVAARNIRTWFLSNETRMDPSLHFVMKDVYFMLDAVRILENDGFLSQAEQSRLRMWFTEYLEWLESSQMARSEFYAQDSHGMYYDIQVVSIAAYIDNPEKMLRYLDRSVARLGVHFYKDGSMPRELSKPSCEHSQMFNLQGWATLARLGEAVGRNLWEYKSTPYARKPTMCRMMRYAIPYFTKRSICAGNNNMEDERRWLPLLQDTRNHCPNLEGRDTFWNAWQDPSIGPPGNTAFDMPSIFDRRDGIAPFWNLGWSFANRDWPAADNIVEKIRSTSDSRLANQAREQAYETAATLPSPEIQIFNTTAIKRKESNQTATIPSAIQNFDIIASKREKSNQEVNPDLQKKSTSPEISSTTKLRKQDSDNRNKSRHPNVSVSAVIPLKLKLAANMFPEKYGKVIKKIHKWHGSRYRRYVNFLIEKALKELDDSGDQQRLPENTLI